MNFVFLPHRLSHRPPLLSFSTHHHHQQASLNLNHAISKIVSILAFAIAAEPAAVATPIERTLDVSTPGDISKRDSYLDVFGSGGSRSTRGGSNLSVSVACGTVTVSNIDGYSGLCTAVLVRAFTPYCRK